MSRGPRGPRKRQRPNRPRIAEDTFPQYEDEDIDLRDTPEYKRRQLIIRIGTSILLFAFISTSGITCVGSALAGGQDPEPVATVSGVPMSPIDGEIASHREQLKKDAGNTEVLASLSAYLIQRGKPEDVKEALTHLEAVLQKEPGNLSVLQMLAVAYERQKDTAKARDSYEKLLKAAQVPVDPKDPGKETKEANQTAAQAEAHRGLGQALLQEGKAEEALKEADESLKLNPGSGPGYLLRARIQMARKQPELARRDYRYALDVAMTLPQGSPEQNALAGEALAALQELEPKSTATPAATGTATPAPVSTPAPAASPTAAATPLAIPSAATNSTTATNATP